MRFRTAQIVLRAADFAPTQTHYAAAFTKTLDVYFRATHDSCSTSSPYLYPELWRRPLQRPTSRSDATSRVSVTARACSPCCDALQGTSPPESVQTPNRARNAKIACWVYLRLRSTTAGIEDEGWAPCLDATMTVAPPAAREQRLGAS